MANVVLEAKDLKKSFGELKAVDQVSFNIYEGQCVAFLGPNGAGKTTTVEILEGLQTSDSGSVRIFDLDIQKDKKKILERTGVLLQETYLYKKQTVKETLELFASFYSNPSPIEEMIKAVQLEDKADTRLENLSGGQKQRVYLACGLINNPSLFFLDEPTTGLDPQARRMIWGLLEDLKSKGCSLLLTTHYMEEAEVLADKVLIIDHGKIIAEGSPSELVREHCGDDQVIIETEEDKSDEAIAEITKRLGVAATVSVLSKNKIVVHSQQAVKTVGDLAPLLESSLVAAIQLKRSNLEDVFLKLTGRSIRDA